jgi:hypothetical protein
MEVPVMARKDVPQTVEEYELHLNAKFGLWLREVAQMFEEDDSMGVRVQQITIKGPKVADGDFMAIVKGYDEDGQPKVAFHYAADVPDLMRGLAKKAASQGLTWKEDRPLPPREA